MGRGRGKGKKQNASAPREGIGGVGEGKMATSRRRGRPQKSSKDDVKGIEDGEAEKVDENGERANGSISDKDVKIQAATENGNKRKRTTQVKENGDSAKDENDVGSKSSTDESVKFVGYRQNGNRRKNKPRRAAEVGVECK